MILNKNIKRISLVCLTVALITAGTLSIVKGFNKPELSLLSFQLNKIELTNSGQTKFPIKQSFHYEIKKGQSSSFDLTIAQYTDEADRLRQAIIFPANKAKGTPVLDLEDLRSRAWQQVTDAIENNVDSKSLFFTWWDNAQRLDLMTGSNTWIKKPVAEMYPSEDEQDVWFAIAGGFDSSDSKIRQLAKLLTMEADLAIDSIKQSVTRDQVPYLLLSIDDLARVQELERLSEQSLGIESRVFYSSENVHTLISKVKQWARAEGTGSYLVQPMPGIGVRAWRIVNQKSKKSLFVRLLPFTHSLEKPLASVEQVFQSDWGGYISIFKLNNK